MNNDRKHEEPNRTGALLYLWRLASQHGGYRLRGVRGWAHLDDVREGTRRRLSEVLPLLHKRGLLDRYDASVPRRMRPVWVYRANEAGARFVAEMTGTSYQELDRLGPVEPDPPIYLPERQWGALLLLRNAHEDPQAPVRFGARGWVTGRELGKRKEAWNQEHGGPPFVAVDTTDLRWLAQWQLAERRDEPAPAGRQLHVVFWRVTELGKQVRLLHWRESRLREP